MRSVLLVAAGVAVFAAVTASIVVRGRGGGEADGGEAIGLLDDRQLAIGQPAPVFALPSVRDPGEVVSLADFHGRAVVVNFYASWCGPCRRELPDFEAVAQEFRDDVVFVAVNVQESRSDALGILEETGVTFSAVLDSDGGVARRYGLRGMPSTYLLDREGVVRKIGPGAIDAAGLRQALQEILGQAPE
ncbi:TlpA disulfide reductase family protein [Tepidiforma sp.]|uniref:TlpA family protein disulfide reductase n=1 Tax=Tepidiforma sp. TaxID=2682230 RepID=UPI002ADD8E64|nr:TlpA disulfide reductase family protein [Tepidiforma sp.]